MVDKNKQNRDDGQEHAASIAVRHLINPEHDRLVEVSYLPVGIVHSLTMIQAYEEQLETLTSQIRHLQKWYVTRGVKRAGKLHHWSVQKIAETIEKDYQALIATDKPESSELFIHRFRHAFYQTSRGRGGQFVESLTILADTDLQTRNPDLEDAFRSPTRSQ